MEFNNFNDILKYFGVMRHPQDKEDDSYDTDIEKIGENINCKDANLDINTGFQNINPMLFVLIGEIIANATSGKLPSAVLNAYGNWLQLIGQVIQTFNAQQQYQECGPGRWYSNIYKNVNNPFCDDMPKGGDGKEKKRKKRHRKKTDVDIEIEKLKTEINILSRKVDTLKK